MSRQVGMKFGRRDLKAMNGALIRAIDWETSSADANRHIPDEHRKSLRTAEKYRKLRTKVFTALKETLK